MSLRLPPPPEDYSADSERNRNRMLEQADRDNHKRGTHVELGEGEKLILRSPDGTRWSLTVANDGIVSATSL